MGWWSATVMGGDSPLDIEGELKDVCGKTYEDVLDRDTINEHLDELGHSISLYQVEQDIAGQVLGVLIMAAGANMPDSIRSTVIACAEADEWMADGDSERTAYITDFIKKVRSYPKNGCLPVTLANEGLLSKLSTVNNPSCVLPN